MTEIKITLPNYIKDKISYSAWTGLSHILHHGWIQNYKWLFSERLGRDVGVPETVDRLFAPTKDFHTVSRFYLLNLDPIPSSENLLNEKNLLRKIIDLEEKAFKYLNSTNDILSNGFIHILWDRCNLNEFKEFRNLLIEGYLLGTDFVSPLWINVNGKTKQTGIIPDGDGANQLEGELRRYWAMKNGISQPVTIKINEEILDNYRKDFLIPYASSTKFAEKLGL